MPEQGRHAPAQTVMAVTAVGADRPVWVGMEPTGIQGENTGNPVATAARADLVVPGAREACRAFREARPVVRANLVTEEPAVRAVTAAPGDLAPMAQMVTSSRFSFPETPMASRVHLADLADPADLAGTAVLVAAEPRMVTGGRAAGAETPATAARGKTGG